MNAETMAAQETFFNAESGLKAWLLTRDHKRIGILFFIATVFALLIGGLSAMAIRVHLLRPAPSLLDAGAYNRLFTLHGIVMVWLFLIPSIPTTFGNFLIPIMIGARDVAFPRLNLASFYLYVAGAAFTMWALIDGGVDTGWTFYTPYSLTSQSSVVAVAIGILILGFSTIATGINFIVTTHTLRAKGMGWMQMPLFVWAIYATSIINVLSKTVLGMSLIVVAIDRLWKLGLFDPALGGDPLLFQHMFWFYSHPAVYIMILPGMGVISEIACAFAHKNPFSYKAIAYSSLGIAFVGFLTWGHHMFVAGMSGFDAGAFGVLSMLVAIFSAIKVFTWTGTLYQGSILVSTPLIYFFAFLFLFVFGGMTGVAVASMSLDIHWTDTYFVVAHFHFIMVGGTLTAWLAAIHYWFPKVTGRRYSETWGYLGAAMVFGGFFFTFFPQFLLGNGGMPRRYYTYPPEFHLLHVSSSAGASILGAGLFVTLGYLIIALVKGAPAGDNPWQAIGLEWRTGSPPPHHNFHEGLVVIPPDYDPYGYWKGT